jgi:CBS domain-containing membrane protein
MASQAPEDGPEVSGAGVWRERLRVLLPASVAVDQRERWRAAIGALLGVALAGLLSRLAGNWVGLNPWLVAPLGASALLVFALPASPLAQPWPVLVGNLVAALVGVVSSIWIPDIAVAGAVAVGVSILCMFATRSLHPPAGAMALYVVLTGAHSLSFALFPVLCNCLLLVGVGVVYNRLTGRAYPHRQVAAAVPASTRFTTADLDAALAHYGQVLDVSRADLAELLKHAEAQAYQRRLGDLKCEDIMTRDVVTADYAMPLEEAWRLMRERGIKGLPVVDTSRRLIGIVTSGDFLRHARLDDIEGLADRLRRLVRASPGAHSDKPEVVGQIMTRKVRVASAGRPLVELVPLLAEGGHHHIPIVDENLRLAGIVTQTDLVSALYAMTPALAARPAQ